MGKEKCAKWNQHSTDTCQRIYKKPLYSPWNMQNEVITVKERKNKKLLLQTPKASCSMTPFLPHSGKGETIGMENRSGFAKGLDWGQGLITKSTMREFLEVMELFLIMVVNARLYANAKTQGTGHQKE